jgi:hypothetical protein
MWNLVFSGSLSLRSSFVEFRLEKILRLFSELAQRWLFKVSSALLPKIRDILSPVVSSTTMQISAVIPLLLLRIKLAVEYPSDNQIFSANNSYEATTARCEIQNIRVVQPELRRTLLRLR